MAVGMVSIPPPHTRPSTRFSPGRATLLLSHLRFQQPGLGRYPTTGRAVPRPARVALPDGCALGATAASRCSAERGRWPGRCFRKKDVTRSIVVGTRIPLMMNEYVITAQRVSDRRLEYTWTPNPFPGASNIMWVEYPFDIAQIKGHDVLYPVLPLFLALGFANARFHLDRKSTRLNSSHRC